MVVDWPPNWIRAALEADGWPVDHELRDPRVLGGGIPHYVIDATDGRILPKRYDQ